MTMKKVDMKYERTLKGFILYIMYAEDDKLRNTLISIAIWTLLLAPVAHYLITGNIK